LQAGPNLAEVLITVGRIQGVRGEAATARARLDEALRLAWEKGPRWVVAAALEELGGLAVRRGDNPDRGARRAGAAAQRRDMGAPVRPADRHDLEDTLAAARTALGSAAFADAWARGHALPAEQIVAHASAAPQARSLQPGSPEYSLEAGLIYDE